jgi:hypothetical protein
VHLLILFAVTSASLAQTLAIRNASVVDVTSGKAARGNVVITGSKITAVGPAARIPRHAKVISGTGKFVIPGLWDMHVHLWESEPMFNLYTAYGVTGIRDMGSEYNRTRGWARQALAGTGPKVFTSGSPVDGVNSEAAKFPVIRVITPNDGRRAADSLDTAGADFIKVLSTVPRDAYFALAQRARVRRAIFAGHVPESVSVMEAIDSRQKSMEHLFGVALACSSEEDDLRKLRRDAIAHKDNEALREIRRRTYATFSEDKATELFGRMARYGVWQVPTLTLRRRLSLIGVEQLAENPQAKCVPKAVRADWKDPAGDLKEVTAETLERLRADYEFHTKLVGIMRRCNVDILAGTDTGDPYVIPGAALHDELSLLVEAGFSSGEALRTATLNPARYFNLEAVYGTIGRGKSADLVILDADPLADIRNTRRIRAVIVRGKLLDRKRLDTMLAPR